MDIWNTHKAQHAEKEGDLKSSIRRSGEEKEREASNPYQESPSSFFFFYFKEMRIDRGFETRGKEEKRKITKKWATTKTKGS